MTGVYVLFLASLFLHGLVIWENPLQRAAALAVGLLMLGATIAMARRGAFASRVVVELREDRREQRLCPEASSRGFVASPAERLSRGVQPEGWATFALEITLTEEKRVGETDS